MKTLLATPHKKARIEIIPLIDIMFFLLACMMLVSLGAIKVQGVKLNLPTAAHSTPENKAGFLTLSIDQAGSLFLDKAPFQLASLGEELKRRHDSDPEIRIYIQGDAQASHGDVIKVLDQVRGAGIQKIAFQTRETGNASVSEAPQPTAPVSQ
ncbi:MAG: biopolymer transporter ExbD [Luteolibacter sp.]